MTSATPLTTDHLHAEPVGAGGRMRRAGARPLRPARGAPDGAERRGRVRRRGHGRVRYDERAPNVTNPEDVPPGRLP